MASLQAGFSPAGVPQWRRAIQSAFTALTNVSQKFSTDDKGKPEGDGLPDVHDRRDAASEWPAFEELIQTESSWDPTAKNPTSTAYGLGQFLTSPTPPYGPRTPDPLVQLPRIFQYLRDRYHGSPAKAIEASQRQGLVRPGWLAAARTDDVANMTGKPELIVPWDNCKLPGWRQFPAANPITTV